MNIGNRVVSKRVIAAGVIGFLLGALWLIAVRFVTWRTDNVHYHANFALYINDEREMFDNFTFYEEVQACVGDAVNDPRTRVHMHDNVNHVVHVHDAAATWGAFFANLGYTLGDELLRTRDELYIDGENGNKLTFVLNGEEVGSIANRTIESEDVLLISYGKSSSAELDERYGSIITDAAEYNTRNDPSSCTGSQEATFGERLREAIGIGH